jgi:hypothetical protein
VLIGGLNVNDPSFGSAFSAKFAGIPPGGTVPVVIKRGNQQLTLNAPTNFRTSERRRIAAMTDAPPKAVAVREGILAGRVRP